MERGILIGLFFAAILNVIFYFIAVKKKIKLRNEKERDNKESENMREANFNAWKEKHDREVKKCECKNPNPRPTDKNNCWDCNGEIYKDWFGKVRWMQNEY